MTWSRFDDAAPKCPKAVAAGNDAWALWAAAVMYCNRHLTDGYVTLAALATDCLPVPITTSRAKKLAKELLDAKVRPDGVGLFEAAGANLFLVHDFLDWNPSKAEVDQKRKADRDRKRGGAQSESAKAPLGIPDGNPTGNPHGIPNGIAADSGGPRASAPTPARAIPSRPASPVPAIQDPKAAAADLSLSGSGAESPAAPRPAAAAAPRLLPSLPVVAETPPISEVRIDRLPTNRAEAELIPICLRAELLERDRYAAGYLEPQRWPEVVAVADALAAAAGQPPPKLGHYDRDSGVRAVVALYAQGYLKSDLMRVARLLPTRPFWNKPDCSRDLATLSPVVVRRELAEQNPTGTPMLSSTARDLLAGAGFDPKVAP